MTLQKSSGQLHTDKRELLLLAGGFLLRFIYVCGTTIFDRQYDIGAIDLTAGHLVSGGHLAYVQYLYENLRLPDVDPTTVYQFHHPPLHHLISALWMRIMSLFLKDPTALAESMQAVPFVCSLVTLWALWLVLGEFDLKKQTRAVLLLLFAIHPSLIMLSGSVNNDCMALMFTVLCVLFGIRYFRTGTWKPLLGMALSLGLGMSTKQNVAELAFPLAACFLYQLVQTIKYKDSGLLKKRIGQYAAFGGISIPLGMWFYVRNLIRYNMSMVWVYELAEDSWQYTGNVPVLNRFLWPLPADILENLRNFRLGCGYNVWMQILRTSVLGEWDMAGVGRSVKLICVFLMLLGGLLAVLALFALVRVFVLPFRTEAGETVSVTDRLLFAGGYATVMVAYLIFAYKYPQECSMHFRYIEVTLLFPAVALGLYLDRVKKPWLRGIVTAAVVAFLLCTLVLLSVWCRI